MSTPNRPEKDLREMAKRAQVARQKKKDHPSASSQITGAGLLKALTLLAAAAGGSYVSQLSLAPVYGEIPSALYHYNACMAVFFGAWFARPWLRKLPVEPAKVLPVAAFCMPAVLHQIFRFSAAWGPKYGPVITQAATYYPLLFATVLSAAFLTETGDLPYDVLVASLSYLVFGIMKDGLPKLLWQHVGSTWILTRCGMSHVLGAVYAMLSPSWLLITTIPALVYSGQYNTMCVTSPALNQTLAASNYSLLARTESNTGYVSILENGEAGFRVMRCDHSLLGGEWIKVPRGYEGLSKFKEPIYAIFVILEAVRLVEPAPRNKHPKALTIGLGIGTSTDALIRHGVDTDIVELDPAVYRYAQEYFALSSNHTAYIEDAVGFVKREAQSATKMYDYILHDVFTGGAVPASLFTLELFSGLRELLADDGVIAVNWAGDLKLKAAISIIETVRAVFNNCRVFREELPDPNTDHPESDFTNMVIFCTKSSTPFSFRAPTEADFLQSLSRRRYLYPQHEIDLDAYYGKGWDARVPVVREDNVGMLDEWQKDSAVGHWRVIRGVVPDAVWENY